MEKGESSLDLCGHADCMGQRHEYCEVDAENPVVDAAIVKELLNPVLYDNNSSIVEHSDISDGITRRVSASRFMNGVEKNAKGTHSPTSTFIEAVHYYNQEDLSEMYGVEASWQTPYNENDIGWVTTKYIVIMSAQGEVSAFVGQDDKVTVNQEDIDMVGLEGVSAGEYRTSKMTHYDWLQLKEYISLLDDSDAKRIDIEGS